MTNAVVRRNTTKKKERPEVAQKKTNTKLKRNRSDGSDYKVHTKTSTQSSFRRKKVSERPAPPRPSIKLILDSVNCQISLEQVLGVSANSNSALAYDVNSGNILYTAGCVCVLYNIKRSKQSHIRNESKKPLTCAAFSKDGKYVVTGESGHQPCVRVWDAVTGSQVSECKGHKFGISTVGFSPNSKIVVSVGFSHDSNVFVWNWKTGQQVAGNKVSSRVFGMAYNEAGTYFLTVGIRFIKYWYFDSNNDHLLQRLNPCENRAAILDQHRNTTFKSVVAGRGNFAHLMFCLSNDGKLFTFGQSRRVERWLDLKVNDAFALYVTSQHLVCGCSDGVVRIFEPATLSHLVNLPKPHPLGVDLSACTSPSCMVSLIPSSDFPDCIGVVADSATNRVITLYRDKSLYIWDITNLQRIGKYRSYLFHNACVCAIEVYPKVLTNTDKKLHLPRGTFFTGSSDNTIKIWNLNTLEPDTQIKRNIYSKELLNQIYTDNDFSWLRSKKNNTISDNLYGVTALAVDPRGDSIASGDRSGNLRVHDLIDMACAEVVLIEAHDAEILALSFTNPDGYWHYLASASRDRLIHLFDVRNDYQLVQTLCDHSAIVTAVQFVERPTDAQLTFLTCSADKSVRFRTGFKNAQNRLNFQTYQHVQEKSTFNDMAIPPSKTKVTTGCQDRYIRTYELSTGKCTNSFKSGGAEDSGMIVNVALDPSGTFIAAAGSDKCIFIHDFTTGERIASLYGHSEMITGLKFTNDCKRLISISGDGCIFVWRLHNEVVKNIKSKLRGQGIVPEMSADTPLASQRPALSPPNEHITPLKLNYDHPIPHPSSEQTTTPCLGADEESLSGSQIDLSCSQIDLSCSQLDLSMTPKRTPENRRKRWGSPDKMTILDSIVIRDSKAGTPVPPEDGTMEPSCNRTEPDGGEEGDKIQKGTGEIPVTPPPLEIEDDDDEDVSVEDGPEDIIFVPPKITSPTSVNKRMSHVFDVNITPLKGSESDIFDRQQEDEDEDFATPENRLKDEEETEEEAVQDPFLENKFTEMAEVELDVSSTDEEQLQGDKTLSPRSANRQSFTRKFYKTTSPPCDNKRSRSKSPRPSPRLSPRVTSHRVKSPVPPRNNECAEKIRQTVEDKIQSKKKEKYGALRSVMSIRKSDKTSDVEVDPMTTPPCQPLGRATPSTDEDFRIHRRPSYRALHTNGLQSSLSSIDCAPTSDTDSSSSKYMSINSRNNETLSSDMSTRGAATALSGKKTGSAAKDKGASGTKDKPTKSKGKKMGIFSHGKSKDPDKENKKKEEKFRKLSKTNTPNLVRKEKDTLTELHSHLSGAFSKYDALLKEPRSQVRDTEISKYDNFFADMLTQLQSRVDTSNKTPVPPAECHAVRCAELCADRILEIVQQKLHENS